MSAFARLEIGQKVANWIEKFFGSSHLRFTELSPSFVKLSRKTGNLRLASSFLNKTPRGVLNQNILRNNFGELSNLSEILKLVTNSKLDYLKLGVSGNIAKRSVKQCRSSTKIFRVCRLDSITRRYLFGIKRGQVKSSSGAYCQCVFKIGSFGQCSSR